VIEVIRPAQPAGNMTVMERPMPSNLLKTGVLIVALTAIFVGMGWLVGGEGGMVVAFVIALGMNLFSLWNSDSVVLRMFNAQEVSQAEVPGLYDIVAGLAQRAQLPMPRVFIMHQAQPNAFATGRSPSRAALCVSTGLLESLDDQELSGVLAHELAHVKNRDTLTMTVAATIGGAISMFANILQFGFLFEHRDERRGGLLGALVAILVAPFAAMLVQMAISRSREYEADRIGSYICGNPLWLARALGKIQAAARQVPNMAAEQVPAAAHMFIINPLTGRGIDNLFVTHPNTENRIAELERLAEEFRHQGLLVDEAPRSTATGQSGPWGRASGGYTRGPWG
jgi:heat shock protein HtpX